LKAIEAWRLCASRETLTELEEVLRRPKFDRYVEEEMRRRFLGLVQQNAQLPWRGVSIVTAAQFLSPT
jgi:predicted nucleic acid-binding protein